MAALHRALTRATEESLLLRRWYDAHVAHERAKHEYAAAYRTLLLERAWAAEREPDQLLQ
jgi:hypothetical protein